MDRWEVFEDAALVRFAVQGHLGAFDVLVRRYRKGALAAANLTGVGLSLAEDAVQDALITAYKVLPSLTDPSRFGPWLNAIARNRAKKLSQRIQREVSLSEELVDRALRKHLLSLGEEPVEESIREAVRALPDAYRQITEMHHIQGISLQEISEHTQLPVSTLKWRLHQARKVLRRRLGDQLWIERTTTSECISRS